jgi:hypothetical protein
MHNARLCVQVVSPAPSCHDKNTCQSHTAKLCLLPVSASCAQAYCPDCVAVALDLPCLILTGPVLPCRLSPRDQHGREKRTARINR